ncbi:MAG: N-acetyltransferase family protein [Pseudomonadales bacterium]
MPHFREATADDLTAIAGLMRAYYTEDGYPFSATAATDALTALQKTPALGRLWALDADGRVAGYLAVTLGFSLEYRGRDAFIDELYIDADQRGLGLGREALQLALDYCESEGVRALHLEVEHHRPSARQLYERMGFEHHDRVLMTRMLKI